MHDYLLNAALLGSSLSWLAAFAMAWDHLQTEHPLILALELILFIMLACLSLASMIYKVVKLKNEGRKNSVVKKPRRKSNLE